MSEFCEVGGCVNNLGVRALTRNHEVQIAVPVGHHILCVTEGAGASPNLVGVYRCCCIRIGA
jgi:hypothetical protein